MQTISRSKFPVLILALFLSTGCVETPKSCKPPERMQCGGSDLSGSDFSGMIMTLSNLDDPYFVPDLSGANLSNADLSKSVISGSNLRGANLNYSNLSFANLYGADLSNADLSGANLIGTNFSYANLFGADLSGAVISDTNFYGARMPNGEIYTD